MERQINRELVKYAVQRAITCKGCGTILDLDDAVLVEIEGSTSITCSHCFSRVLAVLKGGHLVGVETLTATYGDGRLRVHHYEPISLAAPDLGETEITGTQLGLL